MSGSLNGALLVNKHPGVSSFGIIEILQRELAGRLGLRRRDLPKIGHGGTLDPFATGLLVVCVGRGVKVARYFLGSEKVYTGIIRFGETTLPGDPTEPVSQRSERVPSSLEEIRAMARTLTLQPYLQTPPMHSAKKMNGKPLYELARAGLEVEREPKLCHLYSFEILSYEAPLASFRLHCSSGTYVRKLAQDLGQLLGGVAMLDKLERERSGNFELNAAWSTSRIAAAGQEGRNWDELPCWVPFTRLLEGFDRAQATPDEARALLMGQQNVLFSILKRVEPAPVPRAPHDDEQASQLAIYSGSQLVAVAGRSNGIWGLERVFTD